MNTGQVVDGLVLMVGVSVMEYPELWDQTLAMAEERCRAAAVERGHTPTGQVHHEVTFGRYESYTQDGVEMTDLIPCTRDDAEVVQLMVEVSAFPL